MDSDILFGDRDIIFLLGAGCSVEAGIPASASMIDELETILESEDMEDLKKLYNYIRASIHYADGVQGIFSTYIDIEKLVNTLGELEKKELNTIFPFIGSWNPKLISIAGNELENIKRFKDMIIDRLRDWVSIKDDDKTTYFSSFFTFQEEIEFPIRIFSLNYDLCVEKNCPIGKCLERGFGSDKVWDWRRFEENILESVNIYLYKLHGSIDWIRSPNEGNILRFQSTEARQPDLIFGTDSKMQYIDPYLFSLYEFRKYTLEAKYIIIIGYGFNDYHINGILRQALQNNSNRKLIIVSPSANKGEIERKMKLESGCQLIIENAGAKNFLLNKLNYSHLSLLITTSE